jgi:hypothetical protein
MARAKDETPTLLRTLQIEMLEMARKLADLASVPGKTGEHDNRLRTLEGEIKFLRSRIDSLTSVGGPGLSATSALSGQEAALPPASSASGPEGPSMALGIQLLKKGQYASARTIFDGLQNREPTDARVWYFGALAVGLVSGDWDDQATELALKGLERERSGTPPTDQIDATLAKLGPFKGEGWLNSLRRRFVSVNKTPQPGSVSGGGRHRASSQ